MRNIKRQPINPNEKLHINVDIHLKWSCRYCNAQDIDVKVYDTHKEAITTDFKQERHYTNLGKAHEWAQNYAEAVQMMFPTAVMRVTEYANGMKPINNSLVR